MIDVHRDHGEGSDYVSVDGHLCDFVEADRQCLESGMDDNDLPYARFDDAMSEMADSICPFRVLPGDRGSAGGWIGRWIDDV